MRTFSVAFLLLFLVPSSPGQQGQRSVLLPGSEAAQLGRAGSWQPTQADLDGLEANLSHISDLKAKGWKPAKRIDHPERYFRQYLGLLNAGKRMIFVNAFCNAQSSFDWRSRLLLVMDGGSCYWHVTYDPAAKKFSGLEINGYG
jgi:hypothetical protein